MAHNGAAPHAMKICKPERKLPCYLTALRVPILFNSTMHIVADSATHLLLSQMLSALAETGLGPQDVEHLWAVYEKARAAEEKAGFNTGAQG